MSQLWKLVLIALHENEDGAGYRNNVNTVQVIETMLLHSFVKKVIYRNDISPRSQMSTFF